ncbi:hypothetical protein HD806DRAFT_545617 [Xylariaceae sp. AK1471]|nr:hypothetical protein HD806DRAFT_545617 [Xylariaceae sp. AK1471]
MAGYVDNIRGDGLARAQRALLELERDPERLDRVRTRFEDSPPPYTSDQSGTTTRSQSPVFPNEEERRRYERRVQLRRDRIASQPYIQYKRQINEEMGRIWNAERVSNAELNKTQRIPIGSDTRTIARDIVKKRWVEQGIWNNKWNQFASGRWKHEEPLELESESETDEKRQFAEQRVVREREREASRPYHQFIYQVSKERERIQDESASGDGADAADINTTAYENVKNTWTRRGIWNGRWGVLPGMSWKHEKPLEEEDIDGLAPVPANPLADGSHEAGEAPPAAIRLFGSPSPVESNHRQASTALNSPQQGPSTGIYSAGLEKGNTERSPSTPNSPQLRMSKRVLRPTTEQASRPSKRNPSRKDEQLASASLGPTHSSKVAKAARKRKGRQRRLDDSQNVSSDDLPLSSDVDAAESQPSPSSDRVAPRRSKRIQTISKDLTRMASTNPPKRAV